MIVLSGSATYPAVKSADEEIDKLSSELSGIFESGNKITNLKLDFKYNNLNDPNRIFFRSDQFSFAKRGVPAILFYNGAHTNYHKSSDTENKINYELLSKRVKLVFSIAWNIANRDFLLKRDMRLQ